MNVRELDKTYLHRLDVRTKLIAFLGIIIAVFLFNSPIVSFMIAALLFLLVVPSGINLKGVMNALKPLLVLFLIIIVMTCFTAQAGSFEHEFSNQVIFYLLPNHRLPATWGGLFTGITFLFRIFIMVFATSVFTMTTPIDDLLELFSKMKASYGFSILITTAISFIPTMAHKKDMIFQAQKARGAGISKKGMINQLKAFIPIMIPLITNSILMANNLAISMTNRGYGANKSWTSLNDIKMVTKDYVISTLFIALAIICIYLRFVIGAGRI